ncbi:hypothetical protein P692DRAFT_20752676 [Suillus brevipes Sb2]|nr:hypothetical protein P692DRAFT_20752676 [Suillus brevipes Sb2]
MNHSGYHRIIYRHLVYRYCHLSWFVLSPSFTTIRTYSLHFTVTTSTFPATTGCYRNSRNVDFSIPFLLLFVFALLLISLTLIHAIQSWRTAIGPLRAVLVTHNIFYHTCSLCESKFAYISMLIEFLLTTPQKSYSLQVLILAILATRMHLQLWHTDLHVHGSDSLEYICMSDMSPADRTV